MNAEQFKADIPLSTALAAHNGTSFVPERRADQEQEGYANDLARDYETFRELAEKNGTLDLLDEQFARYREGVRKYTLAYLHSRSGIVSFMISGPSNFPVRRMEKRNNACHNHLQRLIDFRARAQKAIRRKLCPTAGPIMSGDSDAQQRLQQNVDEAKRRQAWMKTINAAHKKYLKNPARFDFSDFPKGDQELIRNYKPAYSWEPHPFAPYELTNNSANIRRMEARLATISQNQQRTTEEIEGEHARYEDSPADNRVRLYFPGKPSAEIRSTLKSCGFRWSPTIGAWQAYRNSRSVETARTVAGILVQGGAA
jgi:hypothetical protein